MGMGATRQAATRARFPVIDVARGGETTKQSCTGAHLARGPKEISCPTR
jgi:hypothetical protein